MSKDKLSYSDKDRIIEMAWEDRTPFEAIKYQFELTEQEVIQLLRKELKTNSWKKWRARVQNRKTKHLHKRSFDLGRYKCSRQKAISQNKISQRT